MQMNSGSKNQRAFTLVELSIVLIIITLLSTGLILGVSAQHQIAEHSDTQQQLDNIREALLGFAISKGRLPCPAKPTLASSDANAGLEDCTQEHGVLPWVSLGLPETDPWGNRFSYFASSTFTGTLSAGALASFSLASVGTANIKSSGTATGNIASELPAIILSHGSRAAGAYQPSGNKLAAGSGDELENSDTDTSFISHLPSEDFDDQVTWIVPSILKSRMLAAGRLP